MNPIYITRLIPPAGTETLQREGVAFDINSADVPLSRDELKARVRGRTGLVCLLTDTIDGEILDAAGPQLRVVANVAVGYNNIDVKAAAARGVIVTNTPGVLTESTADLTWALLLASARRLGESERVLRAKNWHGWGILQFLGQELPALLAQSDFVSLHVPLTAETKHLIGRPQFAQMKRGAHLINTARGPVVDEAALVEALRNGTIAGAGLDVYEEEPKLHPGLFELENVVLLPHIGSATHTTRNKMAEMAARNCAAVVKGGAPINAVGA